MAPRVAQTALTATGPYAALNWTRVAADGTWYSSQFSGGQPGTYFSFSERNGTLAVVPEPSAMVMAVVGAVGGGLFIRWRKRRSSVWPRAHAAAQAASRRRPSRRAAPAAIA